jgi:hypothetical protein
MNLKILDGASMPAIFAILATASRALAQNWTCHGGRGHEMPVRIVRYSIAARAVPYRLGAAQHGLYVRDFGPLDLDQLWRVPGRTA